MRTVERFTTAARPDKIWRVLVELDRWPAWNPVMLEIKPLTDKGLSVGARYRVSQPKLRPAVYEVTQYVANERFTWAKILPGGALVADHRLSALNGQTEVELSFASQGFLAHCISALFAKTIRQYVATEARSLKRLCDSF